MTFDVTFIEECQKVGIKLDLIPYHNHNSEYYKKSEVTSLIAAEAALRTAADSALQADIDDAEESIAELAESIGGFASESYVQNAVSGKVDKAQGVANAGKVLGVGSDGNVALVNNDVMEIQSTLSSWNAVRPNQTETPAVTLPAPVSGKRQEILYIFTAMTTGASFTAPSGYILFDGDTAYSGLTAGNTVQYSSLTVGSLYECDFLVVGAGKISLLMVEHKGA